MATVRYLKDRKCWLVRWHITVKIGDFKGRKVAGSKTFKKRRDADDFLAAIRKQEDRVAAGEVPRYESVKTAIDKWSVHLRQYTESTRNLYARYIQKFCDSIDCVHLNQVTPKIIRNYLEQLNHSRSCSTINSHLEVIRSFFKWACQEFNISDPAKEVKPYLEDPPTPRFLTETEYEKICQIATGDTLDWIQFIANTGLRATEFVNLKWSSVAPDLKSITVLGKGRKYRSVPLNSLCIEILNRHKDTSHIFLSKSKQPLKRRNLNTRFRTIARKAKTDNFGPHSLRHFFATRLLLSHVPIQLVSKVLGHSSIQITETIYIHILPAHLAGITEVLL